MSVEVEVFFFDVHVIDANHVFQLFIQCITMNYIDILFFTTADDHNLLH